jgi:hypothetical protein
VVEVKEGILGRLGEDWPQDFFATPIEHRLIDPVDQGEPHLMLLVDLWDVDGVFRDPFKKSRGAGIQGFLRRIHAEFIGQTQWIFTAERGISCTIRFSAEIFGIAYAMRVGSTEGLRD